MPSILLNGEPHETPATTAIQLLEALGLTSQQVAVEINRTIIPRSTHATQPIRDGDQVEVIHFVGGG